MDPSSRVHEEIDFFRQRVGYFADDVAAKQIHQRATLWRNEKSSVRPALRTAHRIASPSEGAGALDVGRATSTPNCGGESAGAASFFIRRSCTSPRRINPTARIVTAK